MEFREINPPRVFRVGHNNDIEISDCARMKLRPDEQITFVTSSGKEYDVAAKSWGFYATPSVNHRLKRFGFKSALVKSEQGRFFIMLVDKDKIKDFQDYQEKERYKIERWLDEL